MAINESSMTTETISKEETFFFMDITDARLNLHFHSFACTNVYDSSKLSFKDQVDYAFEVWYSTSSKENFTFYGTTHRTYNMTVHGLTAGTVYYFKLVVIGENRTVLGESSVSYCRTNSLSGWANRLNPVTIDWAVYNKTKETKTAQERTHPDPFDFFFGEEQQPNYIIQQPFGNYLRFTGLGLLLVSLVGLTASLDKALKRLLDTWLKENKFIRIRERKKGD
ncbi:MAG: hypothetical protein GF308_16645 [Candidatus Heimdallarchaeota archaeon]|nr:hypothetical protein [Candidatus Heimdallarchaeota archaeon]